jgi:hypothetical protein
MRRHLCRLFSNNLPRFPYPHAIPSKFNIRKENLKYDSTKHLTFEPPKYIYDMKFKKHSFTEWEECCKIGQFGFTEPFKLFSDEAVDFLKALVKETNDNPTYSHSNTRSPKHLRGLGYHSKFVKDINRCKEVDSILQKFTKEPICAHGNVSNYGHTNIGIIGKDQPIDSWHVDSVKYVVIIMLSDNQFTEGGQLELAMKNKEEALSKLNQYGTLPESEVLRVNYPKKGWAIFMQGSEIFHHVTPLLKATEPRITMVNSYMPREVSSKENTKYGVFYDWDKEVGYLDHMRIKAWRVSGMMDAILKKDYSDQSIDESKKMIETALKELIETYEILNGADDRVGYFDEKKKVVKNFN